MSKNDKVDENLYVIVRIGWEYNDNYYYKPEFDIASLESVYSLPEVAQEHADDKSYKTFIELLKHKALRSHIDDWVYDEECIRKYIENSHLAIEMDPRGDFFCKEPERLLKKEVLDFMIEFELEFYEVIEVKFVV